MASYKWKTLCNSLGAAYTEDKIKECGNAPRHATAQSSYSTNNYFVFTIPDAVNVDNILVTDLPYTEYMYIGTYIVSSTLDFTSFILSRPTLSIPCLRALLTLWTSMQLHYPLNIRSQMHRMNYARRSNKLTYYNEDICTARRRGIQAVKPGQCKSG